MFSNRRLSPGTLLLAGLLSVLVSLGAFSPASAAGIAATNTSPLPSTLVLRVYDQSRAVYTPLTGAMAVVRTVKGDAVAKGLTDNKGTFKTQLDSGIYSLQVSLTGYKTTGVAVLEIKIGQTKIVPLGMLPKTVPMGSATGSATQGKVTMIILDGSGIVPKPLSSATVAFWDTKGALVVKGLTGKTGQFSVLLTVGTYKISVTANGFKQGYNAAVVKSGERVTVLMTMIK